MLTTIKALKSNDVIKHVQCENGSPSNTGDAHTEINSDSEMFSKRAHEKIFLSQGCCTTLLNTLFLQANKGKDVRMSFLQ